MAEEKPIIVIKKKGGHGGHHGGAWKVAYADFVTAMMAFFMVMWLVNTADSNTKEAVARYFRKPGIFSEGSGTPLQIGGSGIMPEGAPPRRGEKMGLTGKTQSSEPGQYKMDIMTDTPPTNFKHGTGKSEKLLPKDSSESASKGGIKSEDSEEGDDQEKGTKGEDKEKAKLKTLAQLLKAEVSLTPELEKFLGSLEISLEPDGLKLDIIDKGDVSMFAPGSAQILPQAQPAFAKIASLLGKVSNKISLSGHTDSKPFTNIPGGYSNWELSADRANSARRLMEALGIKPERMQSVTGRAATDPREGIDPTSPGNRRITVKIHLPDDNSENKEVEPPAVVKTTPTIAPPPTIIPKVTIPAVTENNTIKEAKKPKGILQDNITLEETIRLSREAENANRNEGWITTYKPKDPVNAKPSKKKRIQLPDGSSGEENSLIFEESPVIDPRDLIVP